MALFNGTFTPDSGSIGNSAIQANAGIEATKLQQRHVKGHDFGQVIGATPSAAEYHLHTARGAGTVREFIGLLNDTGSSTSVSFILKKNGSTILSANATVAHTDADREVKSATISSGSYEAGDVFSVQMTVSSSTGAQGPWCQATFDEAPAV